MINNNNIFIFTSTRADYGLQRWIIKEIQNNNKINTYVVVGGTHLSEEYGNTIEEILKDNIKNIIKVPFLNTSIDASSLTSSIGNGLIKISQIFNIYKSDFIVLLGDRYELFIMAIVALLYQIPIIHLHGGENTTGVIDEQVRHAITKMAHIHMPSTELYAENISKMGEEDWRIHIVGAPGLENIKKLGLYKEEEILKLTSIDVNKNIVICTYHPVTLEGEDNVRWQIKNLLKALSKFDFQIVFTRPNAEVGSDEIVNKIKEFVDNNPKAYFFDSLGSKLYLSFLKYARAVVGNSSSGIIEVPSFSIPTVNIGNRQEGRLRPESVIQTGYSVNEVYKGIEKALCDTEFLTKIKNLKNPYGDGQTSKYVIKAIGEILKIPKKQLLKKRLDFEVKKNEWHRYF
ncbi:UDP-N-acetylglucosamine 2-epimerase (hydrolyzing) [Candidatus Atribacteria bacterium HGW-Atribacteria-1]|nr:MAG: UDP-N-acetylglucosamine 2-epimerase (hydrolyzing) [Candidatus Atribacteria bacterium HGW-Atribacteria-1]